MFHHKWKATSIYVCITFKGLLCTNAATTNPMKLMKVGDTKKSVQSCYRHQGSLRCEHISCDLFRCEQLWGGVHNLLTVVHEGGVTCRPSADIPWRAAAAPAASVHHTDDATVTTGPDGDAATSAAHGHTTKTLYSCHVSTQHRRLHTGSNRSLICDSSDKRF